MTSLSRALGWLLSMLLAAACTRRVEGPTPKIDPEAGPQPAQACNASNDENRAVRTEVTLKASSASFSPLPVDVLGKPTVELPHVFLIRGEGEAAQETSVPDVRFVSTDEIKFIIDAADMLGAGVYDVVVENPNGNRSATDVEIEIVPPPTIDTVRLASAPDATELPELCTGILNEITITGTGFRPDDPPPVIEILQCSNPEDRSTCMVVGAVQNVVVGSDTELRGTIPLLDLEPGTYGVRIANPEAPPCTATLTESFVVPEGATLTTLIPARGWVGIDNPIQIFGEGFAESGTVLLSGAGPNGTDVALVDVNIDASGTRIDATVPAGIEAAGPYDLVYVGPDGCRTVLEGAYSTDAEPTVSISEVISPFGWADDRTPISILGTAFESTPRAYLVIESMTPRMQPLRSTAFLESTSLSSIVPAGLDVGGPYDLVVINPDGGGGMFEAAYRVTALPPPTVDNVTPGAGDTQTDAPVVITGCNFRDGLEVVAINDAGVETAATGVGDPVCDGPAVCAGDSNQCTVTATIPTTGMEVAAYLIRVTNTDENTWGDWSLFVVTQPSAKLDQWRLESQSLSAGRRNHAALSGQIDNASRFLYVLGGDSGSGGENHDTVEVIPLNPFGDLVAPFVQRYRLGSARTGIAAIRSGRFIYVSGGSSDASTGVSTVERAKILDDSDVPEVEDPDVSTLGELAAGVWYYRVAALKADDDRDNPGGETLPSDEIVASLGIGGSVTVTWAAVEGANAYRIYRTEAANGVSTTEVFLEEVGASVLAYTDDGSVAVDTTRVPQRRGATGVWVEVESLRHARFGHAMVLAHDPGGDAYVYVLGGTGSCGGGGGAAAMDCYEVASLSADGAVLSSWADGATTLLSARQSFGAASAENANASQLATDETYVFVSGGVGATTQLEAAAVTAGGQLGAFVELDPPASAQPTMVNGHSMNLVNNGIYVIGGTAGASTAGNVKADAQFSIEFDSPPNRTSFSNSTATMSTPRTSHTVTLEGGLFYAIGGSSDKSNALDSVESIIY